MNDAELALDALILELRLPECEHDAAAMLDAASAITALRARLVGPPDAHYDALTAELRDYEDDSTAQEAASAIDTLRRERDEARQWVNDLQAGMYINCVYCGHRYGPDKDTPVAMADVLKEHISKCPKHPLAAANARIAKLRDRLGFYATGGYGRTHAQMGIQADDALAAPPPETK